MADLAGAEEQTHVIDRAIALRPTGEAADTERAATHLRGELVRDLWVGNHGPWGGYVAALVVQALATALPDLPLLSMTLHLMRPMREGAVDVLVQAEKRGQRLTHASVRVEQNGAAAVLALASLGHNPVSEFVSDLSRPDTPSADQVKRRAESRHAYMQHLDVRPTTVIRPWSGDQTSTLQGWIRLLEPRALDTPVLAALTDAWMPAMWGRLSEPAGKVTVDLTIHFRSSITPGDLGWWFVRQTTRHIERGFAEEDGEVWGSDGRLLAQSRQLVLLSR